MSIHQLSHENAREPEHHESAENGEEVTIATESNPMENICNEIVERIFDYLDVKSLLNVAETCKRFQTIAATRFGHRFGDKPIDMYEMCYFNGKRPPTIDANDFSINITGLKFCLQFLRCFNANIMHLSHVSTHPALKQYINQYCVHTLKTISFAYEDALAFNQFSTPFERVETVKVAFVKFEDRQLIRFANLFPNMCHLEMIHPELDESAIKVSFPHLKELKLRVVWTIKKGKKTNLTANNLSKLLRVNPQLQTLHFQLKSGVDFTELANMISGNPKLVSLDIDFDSYRVFRVSAEELDRFVSEHPLVEKLGLRHYEFRVDDAIAFIHRLKSLEWLEFRVNNRSDVEHFLQQLDKTTWQYSMDYNNRITLTKK